MKKTNELQKLKVVNMGTYLQDMFAQDLAEFQKSADLRTGYANLDDKAGGLYPGLYVLGAISSLGKTTFVHQMADQIAEQGNHVLFFSLEQSVSELAAKSLARMMHDTDAFNAKSSIDIRKDGIDELTKEAIEQYKPIASKMRVIEGTFDTTVEDVEVIVDEYIATNNIKPVVVVDYLQVLQPTQKNTTLKETIDDSIQRLKKLQTKHQLVVIVISSFNRTNYNSQVEFSSFKESGGIEYTADVVWALQLKVINNLVGGIDEIRKKIRDEKRKTPRDVELVCLKNRFGISSYNCYFEYFAQHDMFIPCEDDGSTYYSNI